MVDHREGRKLITVNGSTQSIRFLTEDVCILLFKELLPRKHTLHLDIRIQNVRKTGASGYAESWIENRRRLNHIEIDNQMGSLYEYISTLCHEFVHIKQFTLGELTDKNGKTIWKGDDHTNTAYCRQPWEKEASAMEHGLAKKYIKEELGMTLKEAKQIKVRGYKYFT